MCVKNVMGGRTAGHYIYKCANVLVKGEFVGLRPFRGLNP